MEDGFNAQQDRTHLQILESIVPPALSMLTLMCTDWQLNRMKAKDTGQLRTLQPGRSPAGAQLGERCQLLLEIVGRTPEVDGKELGGMGQGLKSHLVPEDYRCS